MTADTFRISEADSMPHPKWLQMVRAVTLTEKCRGAVASPSKKAVGGRGGLHLTHDAVVFPSLLSFSLLTHQ